MSKKSIIIDGVLYIPEEDKKAVSSISSKGLEYVIIRTYSAGVHAGFLKRKEGKEVELVNARRLWAWYGAASLSQLAREGVKKPKECKFPCELDSITLTEAIEIIPCTEEARLSIASVPEWRED